MASSCDRPAKTTSAGTNRMPPPTPSSPPGQAGGEAEREQAGEVERVHQNTSAAAEASSSTKNAPATARSEMRCWRAVPASTPPTAGAATSRPLRRSTFP